MSNDLNMIREFAQKLQKSLEFGLPGAPAHSIMAPLTRNVEPVEIGKLPNAKKAAVLILFTPLDGKPAITLIERPAYEGVHGGQMSFPGGRIEESDVDVRYTALRETNEELGIDTSKIVTIGKLSDVYIPPSNYYVYPYLGYLPYAPEYFPDAREVKSVVTMPVSILFDPLSKGKMLIERPGISFEAPCYVYQQFRIWGATAIMLSELEWLLTRQV